MRNTSTLAFRPTERFSSARTSNPGPGQYSPPESINPKGQYFVSKFKSSGVGLFGSDIRKSKMIKDSFTPGPGMYDIPSEFGFFEKNLIE